MSLHSESSPASALPPEVVAEFARLHAAAADAERMAAVHATGLLESPVEAAFDRFTRLAHRLLGVPICLLTLVTEERDFVKSAVGLPEPLASARAVPTGEGMPSFCQFIVAGDAPLLVDDAAAHPLFGHFPSVRHAGAAACAGVPLHGPDGHPLGTICAIDVTPRVWSERDREVLLALAEAASAEIALRMETARTQAALAHQALHDALTGLPNRVLLQERVERALDRSRAGRAPSEGVALLFLDLDDFKSVNDTLGHAVGDRLVQGVAERLLAATRGVDTVARLGGDEFAVLLEGLATRGDAEVVVGRVLRALSAPVAIDATGAAVVTAASIGIAHAAPESTPATLLRDADVAMYRAKASGKGRYAVYDPAMEATRRERLEMETELRMLLATPDAAHPDVGALALVYQPVVELDDGRPTSVEALVRWHHPRRGTVPPGAFIPLAEDSGLIIPLGRWVTMAACRQLAAWERTYPDAVVPAMAVNLSGRQLEHPELIAEVAEALRATGVRRDRLTLEITETALAGDPDAARDVLVGLHALGVRLAIDDFGTGYSSLGYLQQFPVDVLKIDKRFVDGVADAGSDAALARTIIALADALGMRTVAEGVELDAQQAALRSLGCRQGQGYLFARPMPSGELDAWLASYAAANRA